MGTSGNRTLGDLRLVGVGAAVGVLAVAAAMLSRGPAPGPVSSIAAPPGWSEIAWPLPVEPWWPSKAYSCAPRTCGSALTLYVRAKIGFCNCKTGVADDEELERIGDFAVLGREHRPTAEGRQIAVAWMKGRARPYVFLTKDGGSLGPTSNLGGKALLIGYNDRCDAIVVTAIVERGEPTAVEGAVLQFLNSAHVMRWAEVTLGL